MRQKLCHLDEIGDGESTAATVERGDRHWPVMLIRRAERVYAYVNSCPHIGAPLDWKPGQFLTQDGTEIICSVHGARFVIEDGNCIAGPCVGRALMPLSVLVEDGAVYAEIIETRA